MSGSLASCLPKLRDLNRKILMHGGLADNSIPTAGWINDYTRVSAAMGGAAAGQKSSCSCK